MNLSKNKEAVHRLHDLLETKYKLYNRVNFIEADPVSIPHRFTKKQDIEIAGFLAATLAWGNRKTIIKNALQLMAWMDEAPHQFIVGHTKAQQKPFLKFVHRTFNGHDAIFFLNALKKIYSNHQSMEAVFNAGISPQAATIKPALVHFRNYFLSTPHLSRSEKHLSNPEAKSSAKRLCMFLRWMVRPPAGGVDFGVWQHIQPSQLCLPLDVHTGRVSRELGLLHRHQNDWQAVEEVTQALKQFDAQDPVKYDFALFGLGVNGEI